MIRNGIRPALMLLTIFSSIPAMAASLPTGGDRAPRPSFNTGTGFFVSGSKLYDANGHEFRLRGVNDIGFWRGGTDRAQQCRSMKEMKVNTVRLVLAHWAADGPAGKDTPGWRQSIAQSFIDQQIVPIPAVWFTRSGAELTCRDDPGAVEKAVDDWVGPDLGWIKQLERYVILNIANEWGPAGSTIWRDTYITAVRRLRAAGINAALMIDAGGCGQDKASIVNFARAVLESDPQRNIIFSVHLYGVAWSTGNLAAGLDELAATGLCIAIGEFSSSDYNRHMGWNPLPPEAVIAGAEQRGFGWLSWQWYNDSAENVVHGPDNQPQPYPPAANLSAFGVAVQQGLQVARPATIFP